MIDSFSRDFTRVKLSTPREFRLFNLWGLRAFLIKETLRFLNIPIQTMLAPVVSALLFLTIFTTAWSRDAVGGVEFPNCKILGNIGDVLMPPLTPLELTIGYLGACLARGLLVGMVVGLAMLPFLDLNKDVVSVGGIILYSINASVMMGSLGILSGVISNKFDHMASISNFIIMPLTFLSGTFYSISALPEKWHVVAVYNPIHYAIDGFRHSIVGYNDSPLSDGLIACVSFNSFLLFLCWLVFNTGYRLEK